MQLRSAEDSDTVSANMLDLLLPLAMTTDRTHLPPQIALQHLTNTTRQPDHANNCVKDCTEQRNIQIDKTTGDAEQLAPSQYSGGWSLQCHDEEGHTVAADPQPPMTHL